MATLYQAQNILSGPGTVFVAPLGTTSPTAVTGDWPTGWVALGYTDAGSDFNWKPTVNPITPEEEYWPAKNVFTGYEAHITFALLELTVQNWQVAMNQGVGTSALSSTVSTNPDGSKNIAFGDVGTEVPLMFGWDSYNKGSSAAAGTPSGPVQGRLYAPSSIQVGQVQVQHKKGANPQMLNLDFMVQKLNATTSPFTIVVPPALV